MEGFIVLIKKSLWKMWKSGILYWKMADKYPVLYTMHKYDTSDRISAQGWQINGQGFSERYTYNDNDGTLTKIQYVDGDAISDGLSGTITFTYGNAAWQDQLTGVSRTDSSGANVSGFATLMDDD